MINTLDIIAIWHGLSTNADFWSDPEEDEDIEINRDEIDESDLSLLKSLEEIEPERWKLLGQAAGWTPIHATALSWCKDVSLSDTLEVWRQIKNLDTNDPSHWRAARLFCPRHLPEEPKLTAYIDRGKTVLSIWVLLSCAIQQKIKIENDLPEERTKSLNKNLQTLLTYMDKF